MGEVGKMRIGLLTKFLVKEGMKDIFEVADWAYENEFEDLEVGPTLPMDYDKCSKVIHSGKIKISSLTYCCNYLSTDMAEATMHI